MASIIGDLGLNAPNIDITGFLSNTWVWIFAVFIIGVILIGTLVMVLYFTTYNKKLVFFENISGQGFQVVKKKRARTLRLGLGGEEILKLIGREFFTAYGRKMGKNTYWFAKGQDGYWYNILLGDLDAKMGMLDIEPVDRDVRMFHVAKDRLNKETYQKQSFMEKYGIQMLMFAFLIVLVLGIWFIVGKVGDATAVLSTTAETNARVAEATSNALQALSNIQTPKSSGIVSATIGGS